MLALEVRDWIRTSKVIGEEMTAIVISHENSPEPVHTVPRKLIPESPEGQDVDDLVETLCKKMENDARGFCGVFCQYFVEAKQGHRSFARIPFGLEIAKTTTRAGRTEKANEEGVISAALRGQQQAMTHADLAVTRALAKAERDVLRADQRFEAGLVREEAMRAELMSLRAENDAMRTQEQLRLENAKAAERHEKRMDELFRDLKTYAPVILNRIAGDDVVPLGELAPEQLLLRQAVRELDGPEVASAIKLLAGANPRVAIMLSELVLKVKGEDERRDRVTEAAREIIAEHKPKEAPKVEPAKASPALNGHAAPKQLEGAGSGHRGSETVPR